MWMGNCVVFDCVCKWKRSHRTSRIVSHPPRKHNRLPHHSLTPRTIQTCSQPFHPANSEPNQKPCGIQSSPCHFSLTLPLPFSHSPHLPTLKPLPNPIPPNLLPLHLRPRNRQLPPQPLKTPLRQLHKRPVQILLIRFLCRCDCFHNIRRATAAGGGQGQVFCGEEAHVAVFVVVHVEVDCAGDCGGGGGWGECVGGAVASVPVVVVVLVVFFGL